MAKIPDKKTFYKLLAEGVLGNTVQCWQSIEAFLADKEFQGEVMLRQSRKSGGGMFQANIPRNQVEEAVAAWVAKGANPAQIRIWEMEPLDRRILCGEVTISETGEPLLSRRGNFKHSKSKMTLMTRAGWYLRYSPLSNITMHDALVYHSQHAFGLAARMILRRYLDTASLESFDELLNEYPGAVIEFSTFNCQIGLFRRNTVIWEVRDY